MTKYFKKLVGEKVYLSPMSVDDAEKFLSWLNDFQVTDGIEISERLYNLTGEKEYLENESKAEDKRSFSILTLADDELIGNCSIMNIDHKNQTAELGIMIGEASARSQGYGTEAMNLLLDFGFNYLNLHQIHLRVLAANKSAVHVYEKCGFKKQGVQRESYFLNGRFIDNIYMDILRSEFGARKYIKNKNM